MILSRDPNPNDNAVLAKDPTEANTRRWLRRLRHIAVLSSLSEEYVNQGRMTKGTDMIMARAYVRVMEVMSSEESVRS
jgi:hypothetical protein